MSRSQAVLDIDALLHDSYLTVVEVNQLPSVTQSQELWTRCLELAEQLRERLREAGFSQRSLDLISLAQCALLDETVIRKCTGEERDAWIKESLQMRFFNSHQAGESLYEEMREVLREPSPDPSVLTVYQRVLMLGFRGRYGEHGGPERDQLVSRLDELVAPLRSRQALLGRTRAGGLFDVLRLHSPWGHALLVGLLLGAAWWGLDLLLGDSLAALLPAGA
ncbi:type VI secretion system protein TssL, short form [Pseudomonas sp. zfem002]|uniref:type VI secretion system protein TssL, short form n=1 Tax=Pseudomonas sp. zfem002 TaxID=3078197 RepID=UPI0029295FF7|nr:type VI secretion system protein TssL, short form [Pseudomonas sp. zfem002]MDU9393628.1 type VI secretion system protein TssL, short form [Pseudomonas sp. zfem002]